MDENLKNAYESMTGVTLKGPCDTCKRFVDVYHRFYSTIAFGDLILKNRIVSYCERCDSMVAISNEKSNSSKSVGE